jgi:hypothetical protein
MRFILILILLGCMTSSVKSYYNMALRMQYNIIKDTILNDSKMPIIYVNKNYDSVDIKNKFLSAEHIYPQSLLNIKQSNDMHNIIKTINTLNVNRSNYRFRDDYDKRDKNWVELEYNNYVNHKNKLFVPNNDSRGFISRALLYMYREYKCNPKKIIDIEILKKWYYNFSPTHEEIYHNMVVKRIQNKNNMFISNYNKKNKGIKKLLDTL